MINEDAFKSIMHEDEAFKAFLDTHGSEPAREQLQKMQMKLSTQIAQFGDERKDWYRRANSMLAVVRLRIDEVKDWDKRQALKWRELAVKVAVDLHDAGFGAEEFPENGSLEEFAAWFATVDYSEGE